MNFREYFALIAPPWLRRYWGERAWGAFAYLSDLMAEGMSQAVKAHLLRQTTSPVDALPSVGTDRRMPRYPAETDDQYRDRLLDAWDAYEKGGTAAAITEQLGHFGLSNTVVVSQKDGWAFENPVDTAQWSRFVVVIEQTHPWSAGTTYGAGSTYADPITYGSDASAVESETVREIVSKWKPAHSRNPYVLVVFGHEYYGDPALSYGGGATYSATADTLKWWNEP